MDQCGTYQMQLLLLSQYYYSYSRQDPSVGIGRVASRCCTIQPALGIGIRSDRAIRQDVDSLQAL